MNLSSKNSKKPPDLRPFRPLNLGSQFVLGGGDRHLTVKTVYDIVARHHIVVCCHIIALTLVQGALHFQGCLAKERELNTA
jgi:hypothetical protein